MGFELGTPDICCANGFRITGLQAVHGGKIDHLQAYNCHGSIHDSWGSDSGEGLCLKSKARVESTELWRRAFKEEATSESVSRLANSLRGIRRSVKLLTGRVARSLPELTIHDVTHLDALWEVASKVAGSDFPLNPLEAYVFGAAVLLHDAGLSFEAYSGGREALRQTLEWRDAHARLSLISSHHGNLAQDADFEALRALHASQATRLAIEPWGCGDETVLLIEDSELRENYGRLIGDIASSHHWDLELVVSRFSVPRPAPAFLDGNWEVDALKIACLLRVADAGHMDGARAPSFLLRLLQMNSLSRMHWVAQNRLGKLTVKADDHSQLAVASNSPFPRDQAAAWWVAFDLVQTFDKELRQCNDVLASSPSPSRTAFERKRVAGAGNVRELAKYIETTGWEPTDSNVHVSDVAALVSKLGGEQLYGKDADRLNIALRELVQNSADAVCARRSVNSGFGGRIVIRLKSGENEKWHLQVDDDGVGMSQDTLTTDLLDFGKSFWASERAAREFPGIHASGYVPRGRFGIGFFSVFMAAKKVRVFSRRFNGGLNDVRCLSFDSGISLRPTLSAQRPEDFGMDFCSRVDLELNPGVVVNPNKLEIRVGLSGHDDFSVKFEDYVAALVAGVDVQVLVETDSGQHCVHERFPPAPEHRAKWLRVLSYLNAGVNVRANAGLMRAIPRLREIRDGNKCYGLAALDVLGQAGGVFLSGKSVGGLVNPHGRHGDAFVGLIDHIPATARRDAGEMAAPRHSIAEWMDEQMRLLKEANLTDVESILASYSICSLGFDPINILRGLVVFTHGGQVSLMSFPQIVEVLRGGSALSFPVSERIENYLDQHSGRLSLPNKLICLVLHGGKFNDAKMDAGVPKEENSLVGVVHRALVNAGVTPKWTKQEKAYTNFLGPGDLLEVSSS